MLEEHRIGASKVQELLIFDSMALRYFVHSDLWISFGAPALIGVTALELELPYPGTLAIFSFFAVLLSYNLQRWVRWKAASSLLSRRTYLIHSSIAAMTTIGLLFFLELPTVLKLAPLALISLLYTLPALVGKKGLRELPYLKLLLIAFSWAYLTVPIPIWGSGKDLDASGWILFAERAAFFIAITIPFDIRDLHRDDPSDRTWPQLMGIRGAKRTALAFLVLFLLSTLLRHSFFPEGDFALMMGYLLTAGVTAPLISGAGVERDELYYTGLLDGTMLFQFLALYLFQLSL